MPARFTTTAYAAPVLMRRLAWMLLPPACRRCGALLEPLAMDTLGFPFLCDRCFTALPWREEPAEWGSVEGVERVWAPWRYAPPVEAWIWQYKYGRRDGWARCLAGLAALVLGAGMPLAAYTHMAPVPLHRRRLHWRGFNQALLLAHRWRRGLRAARLPVPPLAPGLLLRTRHTRPQMELDARTRRKNVAGAFALNPRAPDLAGARVLLVDDVMTTGATLSECAAVLGEAGAASVEALVLARA
jgi:ComF family protein